MQCKARKFWAREALGQTRAERAWKGKESGQSQATKESGSKKGIGTDDQTRHGIHHGRLDVHGGIDKQRDLAAGKRGTTTVAEEQKEVDVPTKIGEEKQLGLDNSSAANGARQMTGDKSETAREMAVGPAAEGAAAANTAKPGKTNSTKRQDATH